MTSVQKSIEVDVPVSTAYNQWTQFAEFPKFMGGVEQVEQLDERTMRWVAEIAGVRREWVATVLEQVPDRKIAWAATEGATNAGAVTFEPLGATRTLVTLELDYEPEGLVEKAGDAVGFVARQAESDLEKFKAFIEARGVETGAWRGEVTDQPAVGTPTVEDAAASRGDSGKAGLTGKAVGAGVAAVAAGAVAATAMSRSGSSESTDADAGTPDVVDVLTTDHHEVMALLTELTATADPAVKRDLADVIISELVRHSVAEEMYVYPAIRRYVPNGEQAVEHDTAEHKQLEITMKQLESVQPDNPRFDQLIAKLEEILTDHVRDEEQDHFPRLRRAVPHAELVEMAGKVEAAKKLAPTRPHPSAPNQQLFHKVVGPGVGMVDRLRDKLTGRTTS